MAITMTDRSARETSSTSTVTTTVVPTSTAQEDERTRNKKESQKTTADYDKLVHQLTPHPLAEKLKFAIGCSQLAVFGWYTAINIAVTTFAEYCDKKLFKSDLVGKIGHHANTTFGSKSRISRRFVRYPDEDSFMVPTFFWLGFVLPAWFFYELWLTYTTEMVYPFRIFIYNAVRLGPMYCNFMYVYVLAHKEGHLNGNLLNLKFSIPILNPFSTSSNKASSKKEINFQFPFNHWVGMFHGVVPGTFTISHIFNHHRHENSYQDVYCTAYRPRDSFKNFVKYLPSWFCYSSNLSTIWFFLTAENKKERKQKKAFELIFWTTYYFLFILACFSLSKSTAIFTSATLIFAFFEANILLAMVNWVWHGFIDEEDPTNAYVNSTTIVDGLNFTLKEEYHVVHHQYPGIHWSKHEQMYEKHEKEYKEKCGGNKTQKPATTPAEKEQELKQIIENNPNKRIIATGFHNQNLFEIFGMMVGQEYGKLADLFYQPFNKQDLSRDEIAELLKRRLQYHGPEVALRIGGVERKDFLNKKGE
ncbi:unnamed protein product [Amoebophrya sp. A120]|nr:unnamed protein product [Amoebophrya sp. A120]|eukprot:GSA120T00016003001.1